MSISLCLVLDKRFTVIFSSCFHLRLGRRKGLDDKTYPAMDLPVHGETDGVNCI